MLSSGCDNAVGDDGERCNAKLSEDNTESHIMNVDKSKQDLLTKIDCIN